MKSMVMALLVMGTVTQAHAFESLVCTLDANKNVNVTVGVDEAYGDTETVLLGIGWNAGSGVKPETKSALLKNGSVAKQLGQGHLVIAFGDDARGSDVEVYDSALLAVGKVGNSNKFKGYISQYDDGVAALAITCVAK